MRGMLAIAGLALFFAVGTAYAADGGTNGSRANNRHNTEKQADKDKDRKDNAHSNKGGDTRGQDRANQVRGANQGKKPQ